MLVWEEGRERKQVVLAIPLLKSHYLKDDESKNSAKYHKILMSRFWEIVLCTSGFFAAMFVCLIKTRAVTRVTADRQQNFIRPPNQYDFSNRNLRCFHLIIQRYSPSMDQRNTIVSYKSSPDCKALWITKRKALYKCILLLLFTHNITFPIWRKGFHKTTNLWIRVHHIHIHPVGYYKIILT